MNKRGREEERLTKQQNGNQNIYTIIILNEDRLNASTKRHRLTQWIKKKQTPHIYIAYRRTTSDTGTHTD